MFGCSSKEVKVKNLPVKETKRTASIEKEDSTEKKDISIYDLKNIPQNIDFFTKNLDTKAPLYSKQKNYEKNYFRVWNIKKPTQSVEDIKWSFRSYVVGKSYGENLHLLKQSFFDKMYKNSNFKNYLKLSKCGITLKHLNIRSFPTLRPLLKDPSLAGEGFPFDYLQNSTIAANKPLFVSHYSKDRRWVYIFSSFASGWVQAADIAFLDKKDTKKWQKAKQVFLIKEGVSIVDAKNNFLFKSRIGMMLPLVSEEKNYYNVLTVSSFKNSEPLFVKLKIPKTIASKKVLTISRDNLNKIIGEVSKSNYGWGGIYEQRDCSSTIRDIYAPFGIWLPRNSFRQSKIGDVIKLDNLTNKEKILKIKKFAIPFKTLLYKKGHIVLYVGTYNDKIIILHNTWGIKTKNEERRVVIGKTIFSTLELGKFQKHYDAKSSILNNLKSMNIFVK